MMSTIEAEYVAVLEMACEMLDRREMQSQIGIAPAVLMHCKNDVGPRAARDPHQTARE